MRLRYVVMTVPLALALVLGSAGCAPKDPVSPTTPVVPSATGGEPTDEPGTSTGTLEPPPPKVEPTVAGLEYRVSYNWAVPSSEVSVKHPFTAPLPGPLPLPYLVGVYVGNHPEDGYQRISFYFRGAFPSYNFSYVKEVLGEGTGEPISLSGNSFLRVGFVDAQAHDNSGNSTIAAKPPKSIGFKNLKSYALAGDFEGHVTYGLGIQSTPNSDHILSIRAGELKKPDGKGGFFYVVHFDVETNATV